jgi:hypothetical protein
MPTSWTQLTLFSSCGICRTITKQSLQCDKALWWGAHFGPNLDEVRSVTKSSDEGHILDYIWSKSATWQSPPMRGTFWTTFGQSPLRDKVLQLGEFFGPHLVEDRCVTKSSKEGHILDHIWSKSTVWQSPPKRGTFIIPHLVKVRCVTKSSDKKHILDHIWLKFAAWQSPPTRGNESFAVFG